MKLKHLEIKNFKGINNLSIGFFEKTQIQGANATGKTTIFDAYSWLLWDKDSLNRSKFNIKPLDFEGKTTDKLNVTVTGVFDIKGQPLNLSKTYREDWKPRRNSIEEYFSGNTTDYYINDVPVKKSDYNDKISEFIEEKEFNLLSNPLYFNQILDKKERREVLFSLIDEVSNYDLINTNKELKDLDLENYSVDELRAMAKASSKKINDEIKSIPARIDELENSKNNFDFTDLEKEKKSIEKELDKIDSQLANTSKLTENISELNSRINELEDEKRKKINTNEDEYRAKQQAIDKEYNDKKNKYFERVYELEKKISDTKHETDSYYNDLKHKQNEKDKVNELIQEFRTKWIEINNSKFDGSFICPTCQREFEEHKKDEILEHFNLNKSKELSSITEKATHLKDELASINEFISKVNEYITNNEKELIKLNDELKQIAEFSEVKEVAEKKDISGEVKVLDDEITSIKQTLERLSNGDNTKLLDDKKELRNRLDEVISALGQKDNNSKIDTRINELKDKEKTLAAKFEEQQYILYLCDEYTKTYTSLVQDKVNSLFEYVEFKLFDTQVNGEVVETAEVTVNGVPYSDVNNAGKINAGLDVINTLSKKIGKHVPIFIDNAESVNELRKTKAQTVELIVSEDKKLKIEGE